MSYLNVNQISTAAGTPSFTTGANTINFGTQSIGASSASTMKNRIINGAMVIDQRNAGASVTPTTSGSWFATDRFAIQVSQNSKLIAQQNAGSVTPPAGFTNYLGFTSNSAYSVVSSDYFVVQQRIEGYNTADLAWGTANAKPVTLSFWAYSSLTATFGGSIQNNAGNRCYVFSYTITSVNTWQFISITIPGDTSGTWLTNNNIGINAYWSLGSGSANSGTAGSWSGTSYLSSTGAVSVVGTNGATLYITGVQLEVGSAATSFDFRHYEQELALCQRYYALFGADSTSVDTYQAFCIGVCYSATAVRGVFSLPVNMRSSPSVSYSGSVRTFDGSTSNAASAILIDQNNLKTPFIQFTTSGMTTGRAAVMSQNGDVNAKVMFSAEL
jgi:hypothetical protein